MTNLLEKYENKELEKLTKGKEIPNFQSGDTIKVNVKIIEGKAQRIQAFEGLCIAKRNAGVNSSFCVRKISNGEGVERVFPLYSSNIDSIVVVRRGSVRRAKLYYMRNLKGKAARIKEKKDMSLSDKSKKESKLDKQKKSNTDKSSKKVNKNLENTNNT